MECQSLCLYLGALEAIFLLLTAKVHPGSQVLNRPFLYVLNSATGGHAHWMKTRCQIFSLDMENSYTIQTEVILW